MTVENVGEYEIEYLGQALPDGHGWGAYVSISGPSSNPMHLNNIFPMQHVSMDIVFESEAAAEAEARKVALAMLEAQHE